jgi:hypothetical protein
MASEIIPEPIPALALPSDFETVALPQLDVIHQKVEATMEQARALEITDAESRIAAGVLVSALKGDSKNAEAVMVPYMTIAQRVVDFIRTKRQRTTNLCEQARMILAGKMSIWDKKEAELAAREQQEAQAKIAKQNEREAKQELKTGQISKAEFKDKVANPPTVTVAAEVPKVAGNVRRVNFSAECIDREKFIQAVIDSANGKNKEKHLRLREVLVIDEKRLSQEARRLIKTGPQDDKHELTVEQFEARYAYYVRVKEDRTY